MSAEQPKRRRRFLEDIPHKQVSEARVTDVPAKGGIMAHREYNVTTACGREISTTFVTRTDERVRCADCKAAMSAGAET